MRMVRWMCGIKLQDIVPSKGLRERLELDDTSHDGLTLLTSINPLQSCV